MRILTFSTLIVILRREFGRQFRMTFNKASNPAFRYSIMLIWLQLCLIKQLGRESSIADIKRQSTVGHIKKPLL
ncbi:hypothetical protein BO71DRAFT_157295 [Aspergillus ellipticus CBS 707.79]|uniref:Uncharacterized protein n=1 Tax=Aspergillus ellipticus CBS 707.79 TaxID=1448320 RepID=A0A319DHV4_9EURO|nr:hypothetical protein BO71DRAFT_157295 [Aspergillus ellipticus CBS 707.79]